MKFYFIVDAQNMYSHNRADKGCRNSDNPDEKSPIIPSGFLSICLCILESSINEYLSGYDFYAQYQLNKYSKNSLLKREYFAMVPVLMSHFGIKHPFSLMYKKRPHSMQDVLDSPQICPITNLLECARRY